MFHVNSNLRVILTNLLSRFHLQFFSLKNLTRFNAKELETFTDSSFRFPLRYHLIWLINLSDGNVNAPQCKLRQGRNGRGKKLIKKSKLVWSNLSLSNAITSRAINLVRHRWFDLSLVFKLTLYFCLLDYFV